VKIRKKERDQKRPGNNRTQINLPDKKTINDKDAVIKRRRERIRKRKLAFQSQLIIEDLSGKNLWIMKSGFFACFFPFLTLFPLGPASLSLSRLIFTKKKEAKEKRKRQKKGQGKRRVKERFTLALFFFLFVSFFSRFSFQERKDKRKKKETRKKRARVNRKK